MKELMTPKQVALALGVSEASLKRWCDKGVIPAIRTAGGHRRLPINGIMQFIRDTGQRLVRPEVLGLPPSTGQTKEAQDRARELFRAALEAGDEEQCRRLIMNLFLEGRKVHGICDHVVAPAFEEIGERWRYGEVDIYQERRGVEIVSRLLHELRLILPPPPEGAPTAIGATLENDPYCLPTSMAEVTLIEAGWTARSYGARHPATTLVSAISEVRPRLFWLSASVIEDVPEFIEECRWIYETAIDCGSAFVIGGRALLPEIRQRIQCSSFCDTLGHLWSLAMALWPPGPFPR
jgi:MerR family transcriptional regulator, light-induced transcriptional regulator